MTTNMPISRTTSVYNKFTDNIKIWKPKLNQECRPILEKVYVLNIVYRDIHMKEKDLKLGNVNIIYGIKNKSLKAQDIERFSI